MDNEWIDPGEQLPEFDKTVVVRFDNSPGSRTLAQLSKLGHWIDEIWKIPSSGKPMTYNKIFAWKKYVPGGRW
jgi:hypothetical protein